MVFDPRLYYYVELPEDTTVLTRELVLDLKLDTKRHLVIPEGITNIEPYAFADTPLKYIDLPSSLCEIGSYTFSGCASLAYIHIPVGVTTIPEGAFEQSGLLQITLPPALEFLHPTAFSGIDPDKLDIFGVPGTLAEEIAHKNGYGFLAHTAEELSYAKKTTHLPISENTPQASPHSNFTPEQEELFNEDDDRYFDDEVIFDDIDDINDDLEDAASSDSNTIPEGNLLCLNI